jgi:hypothetical protein
MNTPARIHRRTYNARPKAVADAEAVQSEFLAAFARDPRSAFAAFERQVRGLTHTNRLPTALERYAALTRTVRGHLERNSADAAAPLFAGLYENGRLDLDMRFECVPGVDMAGPFGHHAPPHLFIVASAPHGLQELLRQAWLRNYQSQTPGIQDIFEALLRCATVNPVPLQHVFFRGYVAHVFGNRPSHGEVLRLLSVESRLAATTIAIRQRQGELTADFARPFGARVGFGERSAGVFRETLLSAAMSAGWAPADYDAWRLNFFPVAVFAGQPVTLGALVVQDEYTDPALARGHLNYVPGMLEEESHD